MKKVGSLLYSIFRNLGIEDKIKLSSMQVEWHNLFTEPLSLHIYPVDMKDGELIINVDSPAWLGQLKFFKQDIIKKLHAYNINSVKFKHGRVYQKKTRNPESYSELRAKKSKPISDSDLEWIDQTISNIQDTDLKESIKKTIEKSLR